MKKICNSFLPDLSCDCNKAPALYKPAPTCAEPVCNLPKICKPDKITLRTQYLAPSVGDDTGPFAPHPGDYYNTVVVYGANGAIYIYDSNGVYTKFPNSLDAGEIEALQQSITLLEEGQANLQTNINAEVNAREQDRDNLQENINKEVEARKAADAELGTRIDEIVNSPDVRYIVESYADLLEITGMTNQDYARVLQDEEHGGASTFYQYHTDASEWGYIGQAGAYYTKTEVNQLLQAKQDKLINQTTLRSVNGNSLLGGGDISTRPMVNTYGLATGEHYEANSAPLHLTFPDYLPEWKQGTFFLFNVSCAGGFVADTYLNFVVLGLNSAVVIQSVQIKSVDTQIFAVAPYGTDISVEISGTASNNITVYANVINFPGD